MFIKPFNFILLYLYLILFTWFCVVHFILKLSRLQLTDVIYSVISYC